MGWAMNILRLSQILCVPTKKSLFHRGKSFAADFIFILILEQRKLANPEQTCGKLKF